MARHVLFVLVAYLMTGCATTEIGKEWRDPSYRGGAGSALVVGLPDNAPQGRECAGELLRQLKERGVNAVSGLDTAAAASKQAGIGKARELGLDVLLVCRYLERKTELDVYPRETETIMFGPEVELWSPVRYAENKYDVFGTAVYDAATGNAVWTALSDTYAGASDKKIIRSYVKAVLDKMTEEGVIAR